MIEELSPAMKEIRSIYDEENQNYVHIWTEHEGFIDLSQTVHISWSLDYASEKDTVIQMEQIPDVIQDLQRRYDAWKEKQDD